MSNKSNILEALRKQRQRVAFDANVQRLYHVDTPHAIRSLERHEELSAQIAELEGEKVAVQKWQVAPNADQLVFSVEPYE
jgi:hypothetical protein